MIGAVDDGIRLGIAPFHSHHTDWTYSLTWYDRLRQSTMTEDLSLASYSKVRCEKVCKLQYMSI